MVFALAAFLAASGPAVAGEPWLAPGDIRVRHDIELLVDEGVIDLPISRWPIPVSDLAAALDKAKLPTAVEPSTGKPGKGARKPVKNSLAPAISAALARLRLIASEGRPTVGYEVRGAAHPTVLRTFNDDPRENGELTGFASGFFGDRWGGRLDVSAVTDQKYQKHVRLDGSYVAGKFGNWIVTAGAQDHWWGSGWEGSLILGSDTRPVPMISLDRAVSEPFETKWLSWMGPWSLTTFMGVLDDARHDYKNVLLWGLRGSFRPAKGLEISIERTAQWCGQGRPCGFGTFMKLFQGQDNAGENVSKQQEPGNQEGSWDIRWASPVWEAPYAIYWQRNGESWRKHPIPEPYRSFDILGIETWWATAADGSSWRAGFESADSTCGPPVSNWSNSSETYWNCAYNHHIYTDGYRFWGRPLGHAMDGDGHMYSGRLIHVDSQGAVLTGILRMTQVNRGGGAPEPVDLNSVGHGSEVWYSADVTYRHPFLSGWVEGAAGCDYRDRRWENTTATVPRVALTWHQEFQ